MATKKMSPFKIVSRRFFGDLTLPKFKKTPKSGTISTIESPAKKFVDIRTRVKKIGGYAMGGQASEGAAKSALLKRQKTARQKEMMDMLRRLYGKQKIVPKKKPKKDK